MLLVLVTSPTQQYLLESLLSIRLTAKVRVGVFSCVNSIVLYNYNIEKE